MSRENVGFLLRAEFPLTFLTLFYAQHFLPCFSLLRRVENSPSTFRSKKKTSEKSTHKFSTSQKLEGTTQGEKIRRFLREFSPFTRAATRWAGELVSSASRWVAQRIHKKVWRLRQHRYPLMQSATTQRGGGEKLCVEFSTENALQQKKTFPDGFHVFRLLPLLFRHAIHVRW